MNTQIISIENAIDKFRSCILEGIEKWVKAGEMLVDLLDNHQVTYEQLEEKCEGITADILKRFEQIGRRQIYPKLLVNTSAGARKLSAMPYSQQVKYCNEPIPLLVRKGEGFDELLVKINDLSADQARQVFSKDGVRTLGAQRAYIQDCEQAAKNAENSEITEWEVPWMVKGKQVVFKHACQMGRKELLSILNEMER
jgi:hypothetical protein